MKLLVLVSEKREVDLFENNFREIFRLHRLITDVHPKFCYDFKKIVLMMQHFCFLKLTDQKMSFLTQTNDYWQVHLLRKF